MKNKIVYDADCKDCKYEKTEQSKEPCRKCENGSCTATEMKFEPKEPEQVLKEQVQQISEENAKNCDADKIIKESVKTWEDWKIDEYNNNFATSKHAKKLPYNNIRNCDTCKHYEDETDCTCNKCEDFDEWRKKPYLGKTYAKDYPKTAKFQVLQEEELELYKVKNAKYGDSFGISVQKYGLISALTRMSDKWNRIENLILNYDDGTDDESLRDSLIDLSAYALMTIIELEDMND